MQLHPFFLPISLAAVTATLSPANAQDFYVEGAVGVIEETTFALSNENLDTNILGGRVGWEVTPYFAVEGEYFAGLNEHNQTDLVRMSEGEPVTGTSELRVASTYGVYGKVNLPIGDYLKLFSRIGYTNIDQDGENSTALDLSDDDNRIAVGIGASYDLTDRIYARVDATSYDLSRDTNSITVGAGIRF